MPHVRPPLIGCEIIFLSDHRQRRRRQNMPAFNVDLTAVEIGVHFRLLTDLWEDPALGGANRPLQQITTQAIR
jgi:hypothetical protein